MEEVQEAGTEGKMALAEPGALAGTARAVAERMPQYQWEFIEAEKEEALEQVKDLVEKGEARGALSWIRMETIPMWWKIAQCRILQEELGGSSVGRRKPFSGRKGSDL